MFIEVLLEALIDSVKMLPFLFAAYLIIEYIERHHGESIERVLAGGGRWGCFAAAVLGCVPQCGFSAAAANFYASRVITMGTMMAVFLATSDEAIPLLIAEPTLWSQMMRLIAVKILFALLFGLLLDFVVFKLLPPSLRGGFRGRADEVDCHEEHEEQGSIVWAALHHTAEIFGFILLFSLVIGFVIESVGQDTFAAFLGGLGVFQPFVAALIGLIPNCAASVMMVSLYQTGAIGFASMVAGLCSGAGVGLAVLWRANPSWKQNLMITVLLWGMGAATGLVLMLLGM